MKDVISSIDCDNWTLVWYNNSLSFLFSLVVLSHSMQKPTLDLSSSRTVGGIVVSCIFGALRIERCANVMTCGEPAQLTTYTGIGISYFGFSARRMCSATAFTVVGCANKFLTVVANAYILQSSASWLGNFALFMCLTASIMYGEFSKHDTVSDKLHDEKHGRLPVSTEEKIPSCWVRIHLGLCGLLPDSELPADG